MGGSLNSCLRLQTTSLAWLRCGALGEALANRLKVAMATPPRLPVMPASFSREPMSLSQRTMQTLASRCMPAISDGGATKRTYAPTALTLCPTHAHTPSLTRTWVYVED